MQQYHQLLGDTADLEQSDSDAMEVQLAALVESQQGRCVSLLFNPWMVLGFKLQLSAWLRNTTSKWTLQYTWYSAQKLALCKDLQLYTDTEGGIDGLNVGEQKWIVLTNTIVYFRSGSGPYFIFHQEVFILH